MTFSLRLGFPVLRTFQNVIEDGIGFAESWGRRPSGNRSWQNTEVGAKLPAPGRRSVVSAERASAPPATATTTLKRFQDPGFPAFQP
jgi:hypothetical protein